LSFGWGLQAPLAEAPMNSVALLTAALAMSTADSIAASSLPVTLSTGQTSTVPLPPYDAAEEDRAPRLVVTVSGYHPAADAPVAVVVSLLCGEGEKVLGRFAVMPRMSFSEAEPARAQHFGLSAPNTPECRAARAASVRLEAVAGGGGGASITISGIAWQ
jgi:hypothetical protein